jgi:hypothetical protein
MTGYEKRDIRFAAIAKAFVGVAILLALVALSSRTVLRVLSSHYPPDVHPNAPPPEPRLQADPVADLRQRRAEEDAALNNYAWVDRSREVIRIPIDRGMALLLQRGLPTRAASPRNRP